LRGNLPLVGEVFNSLSGKAWHSSLCLSDMPLSGENAAKHCLCRLTLRLAYYTICHASWERLKIWRD
jgi:hypothetical protein